MEPCSSTVLIGPHRETQKGKLQANEGQMRRRTGPRETDGRAGGKTGVPIVTLPKAVRTNIRQRTETSDDPGRAPSSHTWHTRTARRCLPGAVPAPLPAQHRPAAAFPHATRTEIPEQTKRRAILTDSAQLHVSKPAARSTSTARAAQAALRRNAPKRGGNRTLRGPSGPGLQNEKQAGKKNAFRNPTRSMGNGIVTLNRVARNLPGRAEPGERERLPRGFR